MCVWGGGVGRASNTFCSRFHFIFFEKVSRKWHKFSPRKSDPSLPFCFLPGSCPSLPDLPTISVNLHTFVSVRKAQENRCFLRTPETNREIPGMCCSLGRHQEKCRARLENRWSSVVAPTSAGTCPSSTHVLQLHSLDSPTPNSSSFGFSPVSAQIFLSLQ